MHRWQHNTKPALNNTNVSKLKQESPIEKRAKHCAANKVDSFNWDKNEGSRKKNTLNARDGEAKDKNAQETIKFFGCPLFWGEKKDCEPKWEQRQNRQTRTTRRKVKNKINQTMIVGSTQNKAETTEKWKKCENSILIFIQYLTLIANREVLWWMMPETWTSRNELSICVNLWNISN